MKVMPPFFHDMLAHARRPVGRQRGSAAGSVQTQAGRGGVGSQRVVDRVDARCRDGGIERTVLRIDDFEGRAVCAGDDIHRADIGIRGVNAEPDRAQAAGDAAVGSRSLSAFRASGAPSGRPVQISSFAFSIFSRVPRFSRCETPIIVMMPALGRAQRVRRSISPAWSMPISTTAYSVSSVGRNSVLGTPMSLFWLPSVFEGLAEGGEHRVAELLRRRLADAARDADHFWG